MAATPKVLVAEKLADSGVDALREHFDVDLGARLEPEELAERIGAYDGLLIRSATQVTADLIARADNLKVIGRAGIGVDNVDVEAATKRGIVVANAPQSNIVAAAEHTMALMLAVARNVPRAHASLTAGRWERSKLSAAPSSTRRRSGCSASAASASSSPRAPAAFGMHVVAFDPFVAEERYRELGVENAPSRRTTCYARADFLTLHLPRTPETRGFLNAEAFAKMQRRRLRRQLRARRADRRRGPAGGARLRQGRGRRPRRLPPGADHRAPAVRLPAGRRHAAPRRLHRGGAGPRRRADRRAGRRGADRRRRLHRGQHPGDLGRGPGAARPVRAAVPQARPARDGASRRARRSTGVEVEYLGRIADRDTRFLTLARAHGDPGRPRRRGGQPRQRAVAGRGARDRRARVARAARARLRRPRPRLDRLRRRARRG